MGLAGGRDSSRQTVGELAWQRLPTSLSRSPWLVPGCCREPPPTLWASGLGCGAAQVEAVMSQLQCPWQR